MNMCSTRFFFQTVEVLVQKHQVYKLQLFMRWNWHDLIHETGDVSLFWRHVHSQCFALNDNQLVAVAVGKVEQKYFMVDCHGSLITVITCLKTTASDVSELMWRKKRFTHVRLKSIKLCLPFRLHICHFHFNKIYFHQWIMTYSNWLVT